MGKPIDCPMKGLHTLEEVIAFAALSHCGQVDKAWATYILHPLRVMMRMDTEEERFTAVLHDVLEDSKWTADDLRRLGCPHVVVEAVECLTRRSGELYADFIERVKRHPLARTVKLADLEDNMNFHRLPELTTSDLRRLQLYHQAWVVLSRP